MAYDEHLADRIRAQFDAKNVRVTEKKMFGGLCFLVKGKMCAGIVKNELMARIDPETYDKALTKKGVRPMDFSGKPMKGFIYVDPGGMDSAKDLRYWIEQCLAFNPKAKSSKKK